MTTLLMILAGVTIGLIAGLTNSGNAQKGENPKKKGFLNSICEGDVTYPGYTVKHKKYLPNL